MTKSKSQLRAEAVERLRDCRYHTLADYVRAMLGWGHEPHFEDSRDALIDLLTDEEPRKFGVTAEQMAKASADYFDKLPSVNGKKVDSSQDSREKLEANMRDLLTDDETCPDADGTASNAPSGDAVTELREFIDDQFAIGKDTWTQGMAIADMVERDYVSRQDFAAQHRTLCAVREQRDEWKAKAKKYANAAESNGDAHRSVLDGDTGTDKGEDGKTPQTARECVDSREKLEADMRKVLQSAYMYAWMHGNENRRGCSFEKLHREFYNLLDRQAAITERHWMEICGANANANVELNRQNDELRLKVRRQGKQLAELEAERDQYRDNMLAQARMVGEVTAERDMYRENLEAESNRTCTLAYDGKWLICSECGESLQWFGVRTIYKDGTQERALGVDGVKYCAFCGARIEVDE